MTPERIILEAMNEHLLLYVQANPIEVAWSGIPFDPTIQYLRPNLLPAQTIPAGLGSDAANRQTGLYQVDVFWPENEGDIGPIEVAGQIIAHFKRGTLLTYSGQDVRINDPPWVAPKVPNVDKVLQFPVNIPYWADTPN